MKTLSNALLTGLIACSALAAQSPIQPVPLFAKIPGAVDPQVATHPSIDRGVPVLLNTSLLYAGAVGDLLRFPAFDGQVFDLRLEERRQYEAVPGAFEWRVSVPGSPEARGAIVVVGDRVASWLAPADGRLSTLALQPTYGNQHCLREVQAKNDYCGCTAAQHGVADLHDGPRVMHSDVSCHDSSTEISVLCVYEEVLARGFGTNAVEAIILAGLAQSTQVMQDSGINTTFVPSSMRPIAYSAGGSDMDAHLDRLTWTDDGIMDEVHTWRRDDGADLVTLIVANHGSHGRVLGIAWVPTSDGSFRPSVGFSVNEFNSVADVTMAHEFGHNFGCFHDRDNASGTPFRPYAYGYRTRYFSNLFDQRWAYTIMAYDPPCGAVVCTFNRAIGFSHPNRYISTTRGNIYVGDANNNNARAVRESVHWVADYSLRLNGVPEISQQPTTQVVCSGSQSNSNILTVVASNTCSYEWFRYSAGWVSTGQTGSSYVLSTVAASDQGLYRCKLTNREGSVYTDNVEIQLGSGASITRQPVDQSVAVGPRSDPAVMSIAASDATSYQWFRQASNGSFVAVAGQTTSELRFASPVCEDSGVYRCRATGVCGVDDSDTATLTVGQAGSTEVYGQGCGSFGGDITTTFYELFSGSMDLQNRAFRFTPTATGWVMDPCYGCFDVTYRNGLQSRDDQLHVNLPLGFAFPLPDGSSTSAVDVDSNGCVGLVSGQLQGPDFSENVNEFLNLAQRIAVFWDDFNPADHGDVYFDTYADRALVTWIGVPQFAAGDRNNFQLQLYPSGEFVLAYGQMGTRDGIVGYSEGGGVADPGSLDLTGVGGTPVELRALSVPVVDQSITLSATATAGTINAVVDLGFLRQSLDLSIVGMPGCSLLTSQDDSLPATVSNGLVETTLTVPNDLNLVGFTLHTQAVLLEPGANRLGVLTSNGVSLTVGSCR